MPVEWLVPGNMYYMIWLSAVWYNHLDDSEAYCRDMPKFSMPQALFFLETQIKDKRVRYYFLDGKNRVYCFISGIHGLWQEQQDES